MALTSSATAVRANSNWSWKQQERRFTNDVFWGNLGFFSPSFEVWTLLLKLFILKLKRCRGVSSLVVFEFVGLNHIVC